MEKRMIWVWVGVAALVIGLSLWALGTFRTSAPPYQSGGPVPAQKNVPSYAPQGQLAPGFPPQLILDQNAVISTSYAVAYDGGKVQYVAKWTSPNAVNVERMIYQSYFKNNGWRASYSGSFNPHYENIAAATGTVSALVNIVEQGKGSAITISYLHD